MVMLSEAFRAAFRH